MNFVKNLKRIAPLIGLVAAFFCGSAHAIAMVQQWSVSTTVTKVGSSWEYEFTVKNNSLESNFASQLALPYFADSGITNLHSPTGWTTSIVDSVGGTPLTNWYLMNAAPKALLWTALDVADMVSQGSSLAGFGFTSTYAPVKGPSIVLFSDGTGGVQDPGLPGSPEALEAGFTDPFPVNFVPEPASLALILAGLAGVGVVTGSRQSRR